MRRRRSRRWSAAGLAAALLIAAGGCGPRSGSGPRSVLLVTIDTLRADALGAYGSPVGATPTLDALAGRGVLFEQCASSSPSTLPSHASLFTAKQPFAHGVRSNGRYVLAPGQLTLAERLSEAGWVTGAETAAAVLRDDSGIDQGFARFRDAEASGVETETIVAGGRRIDTGTRPARDITRRGIEFLRAHRDDAFFLWLHYFDPHVPYAPPEPYLSRFDSPYHGEIARVDAQLEVLLEALEAEGLADRTLVVVTSDHGESLGEHGEATHSAFVYESTIRVPLILAGPGLAAGKRVADPVRSVDVAPTVLDWLGLPAFEDVAGASLLPLLRGEDTALRTAYGESPELRHRFGATMLRFVREGRWKYIHKARPELYDLAADPGESQDRSADQPERAAALRARLGELLEGAAPAGADAAVSLDSETARQLAALGYAVGGPGVEIRDELESFDVDAVDPLDVVDDLRETSRAHGLLDTGQPALALAAFEALLERHPGSPQLLEGVADAQVALGRADAAIATLRRALEIEPGYARFWSNLAELLLLRGELALAESTLRGSLQRWPCDPLAHRLLATTLRRSRGEEAQVEVLEQALDDCGGEPELQNELAFVLATSRDADLRDGERALAPAEAAVEALVPNPLVLDTLAAAQAEAGDIRAAARTGARAMRLAEREGLPQPVRAQLRAHLEAFEAGRAVRE